MAGPSGAKLPTLSTDGRGTVASVHRLGVVCALTAGAWLGSAEAPTKLVTAGYSPILISLCMVSGVFVARWTLPTMMKGTAFVFKDTAERPHLSIWAIFAGALWAVANTLTVIAIRDVGLAIAFPLWNTNSLVGIFWGWLLFGELRGGGRRNATKVLGGAVAILLATVMLTFASMQQGGAHHSQTVPGLLAAFGASLMWGTMYIPYRKAYLSGMNPLSFVTVFTVGESLTMGILALTLSGGGGPLMHQIEEIRPALFWLFLGGFCWVIGDLFQHFATRYIGISRGIPLSNTNQFWGLAWGALVFGEMAGLGRSSQIEIVLGSVMMIGGALAIGSAAAGAGEVSRSDRAIARECERYGLDYEQAVKTQHGIVEERKAAMPRSWWDGLIVLAAVGVFIWLGRSAKRPPLQMDVAWIYLLVFALVLLLGWTGWLLWKRTRFT